MKSFYVFYVGYFIPAFTLVPIIAGFLWLKQLSKAFKMLLLYLVVSFVFNVAGSAMAEYSMNNLPLLHVYTMVEVVTIMLYYLYAFEPGRISAWIKATIVLFPVLCIINVCFIQSPFEYNTYTRPLGALIVIIFTAAYMAMQTGFKNNKLIKRSGRLVANGFMIYFCSSLFQFLFSNVVATHTPKIVTMMIWSIHGTFVMIMYLLFLWAFKHERSE